MNIVTGHEIEGQKSNITIVTQGAKGKGGEYPVYQLFKSDEEGNPATDILLSQVRFQEGPIPEVGVNGVTLESMLTLVIDQLTAYQAGPFASPYNAEALHNAIAARGALQQRTLDRIARNVEGQHVA